jgi:hypothetical protein
MPNWCYNFLTIQGEKKSIKKFKKILFKPTSIDVICPLSEKEKLKNDFIENYKKNNDILNNPRPYVRLMKMDVDLLIKNEMGYSIDEENNRIIKINNEGMLNKFYSMPSELENTKSPCEANQELRDKYGFDNWYDWRINKWGTKWDVDIEFREEDSDNECLFISFDSAWSPPCNWLLKVSQDFPNLKFELEYEEGGCCFKGVTTCYAKEELFDDKCWEWYGDCGECEQDFNQNGECGCVGENGKPLKWGEENDE